MQRITARICMPPYRRLGGCLCQRRLLATRRHCQRPLALACCTIENVPVISAWLAMTAAKVASTTCNTAGRQRRHTRTGSAQAEGSCQGWAALYYPRAPALAVPLNPTQSCHGILEGSRLAGPECRSSGLRLVQDEGCLPQVGEHQAGVDNQDKAELQGRRGGSSSSSSEAQCATGQAGDRVRCQVQQGSSVGSATRTLSLKAVTSLPKAAGAAARART